MKHILENLKLFYINHGGQASDLNGCTRIHQVLKKIATLPLGGGGGEDFVISFTKEENEWSSDRTYAEALEAYNSGKTLVGKFNTYDIIEGFPEGGSCFLKACLVGSFEDVSVDGGVTMDGFSFTTGTNEFILNATLACVNDTTDSIDVHKLNLQ